MSRFCPVYPKPLKRKASALWIFFRKRRSWLDGLFERSYQMKMGHVELPGLKLYMVNEPDLVRRVLVKEAERFPKHRMLGEVLNPLMGESIFTTNGMQWERQRQMMEPAFEQARLKNVFPLMSAAGRAMLQRMDRLDDGAVYDVDVEMTHVTADIILRTILSVPLEGPDAKRIFDAFTRFQKSAPCLVLPVIFRLPKFLSPWIAAYRGKRAAREVRSLLEQFIRVRYEAYQQGQAGDYNDILSSLLHARDPDTGQAFTFDELVDQVAMLFLAGHETSASALSWSLYLISRNPDIQSRMHAELSTILEGDEPKFGDIKKLELTWNVFRETIRLYPPVGFFVRENTHLERMRDKVIKKFSSIVIAPWLIHRHRSLWDDPDEFNPDRYASESAKESLKCAFLPFGLGPRVCMGAAFAMQEASLILSMLVKRYRFEAVSGYEPDPVGRLTIRSENGIRVNIFKRL